MKKIVSFSLQAEEQVRFFWQENKIVQKVRSLNKGKKKFYLMDGPPYASGHIHMGTALNKVLKDIAMRLKRMQGFDVRDQPGYDTHGLPIENKVEAKMGFSSKKQIEEFGVENFVSECKKFATEFIEIMNSEFDDLGVWMDWSHPYLTLDNQYIEGLWWTFKQAFEKQLLFLGKYSVHVCPRCETAVAYNEIEYVKQSDQAVYVKFPLVLEKNKFFVIWTTTPWTLPGNAGIMVNPGFNYVEISAGNDFLIVAKELAEKFCKMLGIECRIVKEFSGRQLLGKRYLNPVLKHLSLGKQESLENAYRVILSDKFVNLSEGTGLVHTAPGHGKEDFEEGTKNGLPVLSLVELNGVFNSMAGKYAGKKVRETNKEIIDDLKKENALLFAEKYLHDYPVCWRCKTSLLMIASPQWFFRISSIRQQLKELNEKVSWIPVYGKARFDNWLDSLGDWPVSRQRYWGTPLPIWTCSQCSEKKVIWSIKELESLSGIKPITELHKPWIDKITINCSCGNKMKRVPEVLDVWFDSGSSSWGSLGFPQKKELFEQFWPADLNIEGKDQIRGWWNSQLITSFISFNSKPFNTIVMHGMVLDVNKSKMSKSLGNIITPKEVIEKQNRDFLRYFLASQSKGEDFSFDWNYFKDISRFFGTFYNLVNFLYMNAGNKNYSGTTKTELFPEDKWILSKYNSLLDECIECYNSFNFSKALSLIDFFVLEEVSRTYIQIVRNRIDSDSRQSMVFCLNQIIFGLLKLLAPVAPHFCEHFFQQIRLSSMPLSIHLFSLPVMEKKLVNKELEKEIANAKQIAQAVLNMREELGFRRRWPLNKLFIKTSSGKEFSNSLQIIASLSNIKKVTETTTEPVNGNFSKRQEQNLELFLDSQTNNELKDEWELMELRRLVQEKRKQLGLLPGEKARLLLDCDDKNFVEKFRQKLELETSTQVIQAKGQLEKFLNKKFFVKLEPINK